jgi:hypothetical protein
MSFLSELKRRKVLRAMTFVLRVCIGAGGGRGDIQQAAKGLHGVDFLRKNPRLQNAISDGEMTMKAGATPWAPGHRRLSNDSYLADGSIRRFSPLAG